MTDDVIAKIKYAMKKNIFKLVISQLIIAFLSFYMICFTLLPAMTSLTSGTFSITSIALLFLTLFVLSALQFVLQYGLFVLVFLFYDDQYAVIAHLFAGFRDFKRAFTLGLVFTGYFMTASILVGIILSALLSFNVIPIDFFTMDILSLIMSAFAVIVLAILYLKFGFAWFFLYENSLLSVKEALTKSRAVTKGNIRNFLHLCLKSAGIYILLFILVYAVQLTLIYAPINLFPEETTLLIISGLNITSTICLFIITLRLCFTLVAMYKIYNESPSFVQEIDNRLNNLQLLAHSDDNRKNNNEL